MKRPPPMESQHWRPLDEPLANHCQQTGADKLAAEDFNRALKAGDLRAQVRYADRHRKPLTTGRLEG
jgi:hypothetical protein